MMTQLFDIAVYNPRNVENVENILPLSATVSEEHNRGGYYGQKIVLRARQRLGLNTCWVGGTFSRKMFRPDGFFGRKTPVRDRGRIRS